MKTLYILTFLIFAISVVQITVFSLHPSQKYYQENFTSLRKDYTNFQNQVVSQFIPLIEKKLQNSSFTQNGKVLSNSKSSSFFVLPFMTNFVSLVAKPYIINGKTFFRHNGFDYKVGDIFEGNRLIHISPSIARTIQKSYLFTSKEDISPSRFVNPSNTIN